MSLVHLEYKYQRPDTRQEDLEAVTRDVSNLVEHLMTRVDNQLGMITTQLESLTMAIKNNLFGIWKDKKMSAHTAIRPETLPTCSRRIHT